MASVSLQAVADQMDATPDGMTAYLDRETGELFTVRDQVVNLLDDDPDAVAPEGEEADYEAVLRIMDDEADRYVALPARDEINEWQILSDYADTRDDPKARRDLRLAVQGSGAFRRFKIAIRDHGLEKDWKEFRTRAMLTIAEDFLDDEDIEFEE